MSLLGGLLAVYGLIMLLFPIMRLVIPWLKPDKADKGRMVVAGASLLLSCVIFMFTQNGG
ncbi:MAG: hypothetical protein WCZ90_19490 [Melioribacteraceae bacterium]